MTASTGTGAVHLGMIHRRHRRPGRGAMTGFAHIGRIDMACG